MRFKRNLIASLLGGAMLALPLTVPAFAQPSSSTESNYIEPVDWWHHHDRDDYYRHRGWGGGYYRWGHRPWGYGACERARELEHQAWQDRWRGHPAAGYDVAQMAASARARCYNRY